MASYLIALHETDISTDHLIRQFRQTALAVNQEYMKKHGLCECTTACFPVIRELRIFEFDILESATKSFETLLERLGIRSYSPKAWIQRILKRIWKLVIKGKTEGIEFPLITNTAGRINNRSRVLFKKPDNGFIQNRNFNYCERCNKPYPQDWC